MKTGLTEKEAQLYCKYHTQEGGCFYSGVCCKSLSVEQANERISDEEREKEFLPYKESKMLKELDFDESSSEVCCNLAEMERLYEYSKKEVKNSELQNPSHYARPYYQQVEEWLWEKHQVRIQVASTIGIVKGVNNKYVSDVKKNERLVCNEIIYFDSPITAKNEGICKAIEYLIAQRLLAVAPINTKTNPPTKTISEEDKQVTRDKISAIRNDQNKTREEKQELIIIEYQKLISSSLPPTKTEEETKFGQ